MQIWQFCSCDKFVLALATPSTETTEGVPLVDAEAFGTPFASGEPAVALRSNSCGGCYTCQNTRSKAYPSASGSSISSGPMGGVDVEQTSNINTPRGRRDRFSAFSDRVPAPLSG